MDFDGYKKEFKINKWACMEPLVFVESQRLKRGFKVDINSPIKEVDVRNTKPDFLNDSYIPDKFWLGVGVKEKDPLLSNMLYKDPCKDLLKEIELILNNIASEWEITGSWYISYNRGSWVWPHNHTTYAAKNKQLQHNIISGLVCLISSYGDGTLRFEDDTYCDMAQGDMILFDSKLNHWCDVVHEPKVVLSFDVHIKEPV